MSLLADAASTALRDAGPRSWIWAVVAGLVLGGALVVHAGVMIARSFPEEVRAAATGAVKRRPRLVAIVLLVAAWTIVYGLYSVAYPSGARIEGARATATRSAFSADGPPRPANGPSGGDGSGVSVGGVAPLTVDASAPLAVPVGGEGFDASPAGPAAAPTATPGAPPPGGGATPPPANCQAAAVVDTVRQVQAMAEALTGAKLGSDLAAVMAGVAGCPTSAAQRSGS
jgi:hypothetical protein